MGDLLDETEIIKQSSETVFRYIYKKYSNRLYFIVRRLVFVHTDANEILQDTLSMAMSSLSQYNAKVPLFDWLCKIAVGQTLNYIGKRNQTYSFAVASYEEEAAENLPADKLFVGDETQVKFQAALAALPIRQRVVFVLGYFYKMEYEEMSMILEAPADALSTMFNTAELKLKDNIVGKVEDNCFNVPDGYFEKLENDMLGRISSPAEKHRMEVLKPYIYLVVFIAALYGMVRLFVYFTS